MVGHVVEKHRGCHDSPQLCMLRTRHSRPAKSWLQTGHVALVCGTRRGCMVVYVRVGRTIVLRRLLVVFLVASVVPSACPSCCVVAVVGGKPGEHHAARPSSNFAVSVRGCGCSVIVVMLKSWHRNMSLQWVCVISRVAQSSGRSRPVPVVVKVAFPTMAHTGRDVVAVYASYVPMAPSPYAVLAVGIMMVSSRDVHVSASESVLIGMADRTPCKRVKVSPVGERAQST